MYYEASNHDYSKEQWIKSQRQTRDLVLGVTNQVWPGQAIPHFFFSNGLKSPNCAKKGFGPGTLQFLLCYNRGLTPVLQTDVTVNVQQTC